MSVQRAPAAGAQPAQNVAAADWLVEDGAENLAPGQLPKTVWLSELRAAICARAEQELAPVGKSTEGCPILAFWIGYFSARAAAEVRAAAVRYAPELAVVTNARDAISPIVERVGAAVAVYARTGEITGVPEGVGTDADEAPPAAPVDNVQRKERAGGGVASGSHGATNAGLGVGAILGRLGTGRPLDGGVRSRMEPLFGQDFSGVRVHQGSEAASLSAGLDARAFTVGHHIALAPGEYQPGTIFGDALLAHELAHVVQQSGAARTVAPLRDGSSAYNAFEQDADTAAAGVVTSLWGGTKAALAAGLAGAMPRLRGGLGVQRCSTTVYHCPKGMSWKQLPKPAGVGPVCICAWKCQPGEEGDYVAPSRNPRQQEYRCPAGMNCETGKKIVYYEEINEGKIVKGEDGVIRDYTAGIELAPGAHFTPMTGQPMCGCLPLDIEGSPTGKKRTYTPALSEPGMEATDLFPGRAAKAMQGLSGPRRSEPVPGRAPMEPEAIRSRADPTPPAVQAPARPAQPPAAQPPVAALPPAKPPAAAPPAAAPPPAKAPAAEPPAKPTVTPPEVQPQPPPEPPPTGKAAKPKTPPPPSAAATGGGAAGVAPGGPTYTARVDSFTRPTSLTNERLEANMGPLRANPDAVFARLGPLRQSGPTNSIIDVGSMNILKGNIGELLSMPIQQARLAAVNAGKGGGGARLEHDIRIQLPEADGKLGPRKLFSDGLIVREAGGNLHVSDVFEIKSGRKGGAEATGQVFEWIEGRIADGATITLKNGQRYRYAPDETGPGRIIGLQRAQRHLISPMGSENLGAKSGEQIAKAPQRHALPVTPAELNYLARLALETMTGAQAAPPPAPAPSPLVLPPPTTPGTTVIPGRRDD